jgi:hypothetical protein
VHAHTELLIRIKQLVLPHSNDGLLCKVKKCNGSLQCRWFIKINEVILELQLPIFPGSEQLLQEERDLENNLQNRE